MTPPVTLALVASGSLEFIDQYLDELTQDLDPRFIQLVVVDNGTLDCQNDLFRTLVKRFPSAKPVVISKNRGLGFAALVGMAEGRYSDSVGWCPIDGSISAGALREFITKLKQKDLSKLIVCRPPKRTIGEWVSTVFRAIGLFPIFRTWIGDPTAVPMVMPQSVFKSLNNAPHGPSLPAYIRVAAAHLGIAIDRCPIGAPQPPFSAGFKRDLDRWRKEIVKRTITKIG